MDQKSSDVITLVLMGAGLAAGWWYTRDIQALRRNRYLSREECESDYSPGACSFDKDAWVGPWYLQDARMRARDPGNPGAGRCLEASGGRFGGRGPIGTEDGYRHGFGGIARSGRIGG